MPNRVLEGCQRTSFDHFDGIKEGLMELVCLVILAVKKRDGGEGSSWLESFFRQGADAGLSE
jgi:hypothetical protein